MRVANELVFPGGSNISASATSGSFSLFNIYGFSAQFVLTGAPVGSLEVQVSCDPGSPLPGSAMQSPATPNNWTTLADSPTAISSATTVVFNVNLAFYNWVRFVYTATSGTGSITGRINVKGA